ncbi:hypothetical protein BC829DRAFT_48705 [Chytridium lagenaria]|nr:hypothetical protein BC829DRAFT_48705 [Chytridium lagenaria]
MKHRIARLRERMSYAEAAIFEVQKGLDIVLKRLDVLRNMPMSKEQEELIAMLMVEENNLNDEQLRYESAYWELHDQMEQSSEALASLSDAYVEKIARGHHPETSAPEIPDPEVIEIPLTVASSESPTHQNTRTHIGVTKTRRGFLMSLQSPGTSLNLTLKFHTGPEKHLMLKNELVALDALKGIAGVPGLVWSSSTASTMILTPFCSPLRERDLGSARALIKVVETLERVHECGFVHRDLSLKNVMMAETGDVYIVGWGCAITSTQEFMGNTTYASDRVLKLLMSEVYYFVYRPEDDLVAWVKIFAMMVEESFGRVEVESWDGFFEAYPRFEVLRKCALRRDYSALKEMRGGCWKKARNNWRGVDESLETFMLCSPRLVELSPHFLNTLAGFLYVLDYFFSSFV